MTNSIFFGVWTRSCDAYGVYCTESMNYCDHRDEKYWCCQRDIVTTYADGRRMFCRRITPKC